MNDRNPDDNVPKELDPRTQTAGKSHDAKKSMATAAKVPPSQVDLKVGIEDDYPGEHTVDRDVDGGNPTPGSAA